jgi:hypothetical protein
VGANEYVGIIISPTAPTLTGLQRQASAAVAEFSATARRAFIAAVRPFWNLDLEPAVSQQSGAFDDLGDRFVADECRWKGRWAGMETVMDAD